MKVSQEGKWEIRSSQESYLECSFQAKSGLASSKTLLCSSFSLLKPLLPGTPLVFLSKALQKKRLLPFSFSQRKISAQYLPPPVPVFCSKPLPASLCTIPPIRHLHPPPWPTILSCYTSHVAAFMHREVPPTQKKGKFSLSLLFQIIKIVIKK